jgi:MarR family transcriptional regulator, multiple antibiotic resistance protein MarR
MPVRPPQNRQKPIYAASRYVSHDNPLFLMNLLRTKYIAMLDAALSGQGITAAQWGILRMIFDGRGNTAAALCRHYGYDTGSMTRMLDRLADKGLIERQRCGDDRRQVLLALTGDGKKMVTSGVTEAVTALNHYVSGFSGDEVETLTGFLRRMLTNADTDPS